MVSETGAVGVITRRAYARVGLLGNPSDGYGGKCVSLAIENYHAEVRLTPNQQPFSPRICIEPGPHDVSNFDCLKTLATRTKAHGYYGGVRLLRALCYKFSEYCDANGLTLHARGFTLDYKTNIPKQTGLSGSSALVVAALNCLATHYDVEIPLDDRPTLALSAETDLGITAGLQDRVAQVYEGVVYMDFADEAMTGRGTYERLDAAALPPLYLVWCDNPSDSGKVHSDVRRRWDEGDALVRETMREIAGYAEAGADAMRRVHHAYTGPRTTAFAMCTSILKDVSFPGASHARLRPTFKRVRCRTRRDAPRRLSTPPSD
jgi:glucuronokinase